MTRKASLWLVAVAVVFYAAQLGAHHSISAEFDTNKPIKFTGKVTKVEWMNPHIYTHVEAVDPDTGKTVTFKVEGGPPNSLYRQGWRKDTVSRRSPPRMASASTAAPARLAPAAKARRITRQL
jgi:hypothetical protein